jgi:hypothetical protein
MMKSLSGRVPTNSCNSAEVPCVHFMCQCVNVQKPCEDSLLTGALRRTLHAAPVDVASGAAACKWKSEGSMSGWGEAATCEDLRDLDRAGGASSAADSSDVSTASGRKGPCKRKWSSEVHINS